MKKEDEQLRGNLVNLVQHWERLRESVCQSSHTSRMNCQQMMIILNWWLPISNIKKRWFGIAYFDLNGVFFFKYVCQWISVFDFSVWQTVAYNSTPPSIAVARSLYHWMGVDEKAVGEIESVWRWMRRCMRVYGGEWEGRKRSHFPSLLSGD